MGRIFSALLLLCLLSPSAHAAQPLRPYAGCGVIELSLAPGAQPEPLLFYQEPGVARIGESAPWSLPRLSAGADQPLIAVSARRDGWIRVAYDEAGREGWVAQARAWRYLHWPEFLAGRQVRILPGLMKGLYALRSEPLEGASLHGALGREQAVRVLQVKDGWAEAEEPAGWFRWRDGDGRLTVSLE